MTRPFWVRLHRWVGLAMTAFLIITALTGSLLAFKTEINEAIGARPSPHIAVQDKPLLDAFALRDRAVMLEPRGEFGQLPLQVNADRVFEIQVYGSIDPSTGQRHELDYAALQLDPYSGELIRRIGRDSFGQGPLWPITRDNVMNLAYALHTRLAIPGNAGVWTLGIVAIAWTLDCFVGFYLTLPQHRLAPTMGLPGHARRRSWLGRWTRAWAPSFRGRTYRIHFKLHTAASLWTWGMLLVFAWSSVYFQLGQQVYQPVMSLFGMRPIMEELYNQPDLAKPRPPSLSWRQAATIGAQLAAERAPIEGFLPMQPLRLQYDEATGTFIYSIASSRSPAADSPGTHIVFDGDTGKLWKVFHITGQDGGTTFTSWIALLHMAQIWGLPLRIFVCSMGLVITLLCVTGVTIWLKKRKARRNSMQQRTRLEVVTLPPESQ